MSEAESHGPQVDPGEQLLHALTVPDWWDLSVEPLRPRSFAFKVESPFSVNVASLIGLEGAVRHLEETLHCPNGGIVSFNCGRARDIGFDARLEVDPQDAGNTAHANVYYGGSNSRRKRDAKTLAEMCTPFISRVLNLPFAPLRLRAFAKSLDRKSPHSLSIALVETFKPLMDGL